jgi:hypothetical protein
MSSTPIATWLEEAPHATVDDPEAIVVTEATGADEAVCSFLSECLIENRTALRVARDMTEIMGWERVRPRLTPALLQVRRGDFGEVVAIEVLREFAGLLIPVVKVRHQIHAGQTLIGADVVALEVDDDDVVTSVHFGEVKFRSTADTSAATEAHSQLQQWHVAEFFDVLFFVATHLIDSQPALYESLHAYLRDEDERNDCFHIFLVWDAASWSETVLDNLVALDERLAPLTVRIALIDDLTALCDKAYAGMAELLDK